LPARTKFGRKMAQRSDAKKVALKQREFQIL
jgi:hypothetical protein